MRKKLNAKKIASLILLYGLLLIILNANRFIPGLWAWQNSTWKWNYIGVSGNYILFIVYLLYNKKTLSQLGVQVGKWKEKIKWYLVIVLFMLLLTRGLDLLNSGRLDFTIPYFSTMFFQLIFVSMGEELFYRGILQTDYGFWPATILFGATHILNGDFAGMLAATLIGAILGLVRSKTDSVPSSALLHGLINFTNVFFK